MTTFTRTGKDQWTAQVGEKTVYVTRTVARRTTTRRTGIMSWQKCRATSSLTFVRATVRGADGRLVQLEAFRSVREAQAGGVRYAETGAGTVNEMMTKCIND